MIKYGKGLKMIGNFVNGDFAYFVASDRIKIGDNLIMSSYISFYSENHNFKDKEILIWEQGVISKEIRLGDNICVAAKETFLSGFSIADNSIVTANAAIAVTSQKIQLLLVN